MDSINEIKNHQKELEIDINAAIAKFIYYTEIIPQSINISFLHSLNLSGEKRLLKSQTKIHLPNLFE